MDTLAIANGLPLTLGISKGFFAAQGLEIKPKIFASGNDIVLAMANGQRRHRIHGLHPAMIGRTQGVAPLSILAASETEGSDGGRQLAERRGRRVELDPHAQGPRRQDDRSERAQGCHRARRPGALDKLGIDSNSVKFATMPFPDDAGRARERPGRRDPHARAVHVADLARGGRIVLAPGPVITPFLPNGCYCARADWMAKNPGAREAVPGSDQPVADVLEQPPRRGRALLPASIRNIRLPTGARCSTARSSCC